MCRPSTRTVGTTNQDGSYTTADGRTFEGPHADINKKYDELLSEDKVEEAEDFGRKAHDDIKTCKKVGHTFFIEIGVGKTEVKKGECWCNMCFQNSFGIYFEGI